MGAEAENCCHAWSSSILNLDTDKPESEVQARFKSPESLTLYSHFMGRQERILSDYYYVIDMCNTNHVHSVKGVCSML